MEREVSQRREKRQYGERVCEGTDVEFGVLAGSFAEGLLGLLISAFANYLAGSPACCCGCHNTEEVMGCLTG